MQTPHNWSPYFLGQNTYHDETGGAMSDLATRVRVETHRSISTRQQRFDESCGIRVGSTITSIMTKSGNPPIFSNLCAVKQKAWNSE